jgi:hypothetical protein
MKFSENPYYKKHVPDWILRNEKLMKSNTNPKYKHVSRFLADHKQDGWITCKVFNDYDKTAPWETMETISFSEIYRELADSKTLCPSNFVVQVVKKLKKYAEEHSLDLDQMFYIGTISRSLRTFASMLREEFLAEIIDEIMSEIVKGTGKTYKVYQSSAKDDMTTKTDVMLVYDGVEYRIWSYQTTESGIEKTSNRVLNANGKGYNILMPFNTNEKETKLGWWMYDRALVKKIIEEFVVHRDFEPMSHEEYKVLVKADPNVIKKPAIFKV